jgi:hypothetical protein
LGREAAKNTKAPDFDPQAQNISATSRREIAAARKFRTGKQYQSCNQE